MRILMATDGSSDSIQAVEWLAQFPLPADATVEVLSAAPWPTFDESIVSVQAWGEIRKHAEAVVEDARRRLAKRWSHVTGRIATGDAREVIIESAAASKTDLIVMGARGLGAVASALLGSVSLGVARHAPCPVLICRGIARPVKAATMGLDGSGNARMALAYFCELPLPADLAMHFVGVVEPLRYPATTPEMISATIIASIKQYEDERRRELETVVRAAAAEVRPRVGTITTTTPVGAAAPTILSEAHKHDSDLVVVGARGIGTLKRLLLGSVSESVLRHANCPVLIVRPRAV